MLPGNDSAQNLQIANGFVENQSAPMPPRAAFLASLDVELPVRGREFLFTTPGGELKLNAQSVAEETVVRVLTTLWLLAIACVVAIAYRIARRLIASRSGRWITAIALMLLGLISLTVGWLPVYGVLCLLSAVALMLSPRAPKPALQQVTLSR